MKAVTGTVTVTHHENGTCDFVVVLASGELAASGERMMLTRAAIDIGSAFLLEADGD